MLTVTTRATDLSLLSLSELRAAAGVSNGNRDAELSEIGKRVAAMITRACRVAADGAVPPTLRKETLTETLRSKCRETLLLSRRPVVSIGSITESGTVLDSSQYERADAAGLLKRLAGDSYTSWSSGAIVVVYDAGWATVPDDLKAAAVKLVNTLTSEAGRDPNLKRIKIEGVSEREYWVPPTTDPAIPAEIMDMLGPYRNASFG